jgi:hypothetical protein
MSANDKEQSQRGKRHTEYGGNKKKVGINR